MSSAADRAMRLLNGLVVDESGRRWGERATELQREDARALLDPDGVRKHWIGRPRGFSKTDDLGAFSIAALVTQLSTGMEAIAVAADRDQARILIDHIRPLVQRTPELRGVVEVGTYDVRVGNVRLEAMAADGASAWGRSPAWAVVDELCQWRDVPNAREMWEAIATAIPKVRGRLMVITTAGDPGHWSRGVYEHALEDSLWRVSETHDQAPWMDPFELESERKRLPDSAWQRFFENRWCATEDRLLSYEDLRACAVLPGRLEAEQGVRYLLGVDLGVRDDPSVIAVCHCEEMEGLGERRVVVDSLDVFPPTRQREVDLQAVEGCVRARSEQYNRAPVRFDPAMAYQMMQRLTAAGLSVSEHKHTAQSNSDRALLVLELVRGRRLWLPDDKETLAEFASVRLREPSPGVFRYDHDSGKHDDRVTAISIAALHLLERPALSPIPAGFSFVGNPGRSSHDIDGSLFGSDSGRGYRRIPRPGDPPMGDPPERPVGFPQRRRSRWEIS